jgi:hypothetical protein
MSAGIPACRRPAAGKPEGHRDAAPRCGVRGQGDRRQGTTTTAMAAIRTFMAGFLANTLMNYVVHYAVDLRYDAYFMPVNAVDLRCWSCRSILSVIKMRAR